MIADFDRDRAMAELMLEKYGQQDDDTPIAWFGMDDNDLLAAWKDIDEEQLETMLERLQELDPDQAHRLLVLFGRQHGYIPGLPFPFMPHDELQRRRERAMLSDKPQLWAFRIVGSLALIGLGFMAVMIGLGGG